MDRENDSPRHGLFSRGLSYLRTGLTGDERRGERCRGGAFSFISGSVDTAPRLLGWPAMSEEAHQRHSDGTVF